MIIRKITHTHTPFGGGGGEVVERHAGMFVQKLYTVCVLAYYTRFLIMIFVFCLHLRCSTWVVLRLLALWHQLRNLAGCNGAFFSESPDFCILASLHRGQDCSLCFYLSNYFAFCLWPMSKTMVFCCFSDIPEGWKREWEGKRGFTCGQVESFGLVSYSANPRPALVFFFFFCLAWLLWRRFSGFACY